MLQYCFGGLWRRRCKYYDVMDGRNRRGWWWKRLNGVGRSFCVGWSTTIFLRHVSGEHVLVSGCPAWVTVFRFFFSPALVWLTATIEQHFIMQSQHKIIRTLVQRRLTRRQTNKVIDSSFYFLVVRVAVDDIFSRLEMRNWNLLNRFTTIERLRDRIYGRN